MKETVGVAICTYNGMEFIEEQLNSIVNQSVKPDAIVIVDDCSSDKTFTFLENFKHSCSLQIFLYRNEINIGSTKSFEHAIKYSKSDILFLADQDDIWELNKIELILLKFNNPDIGLVFTDALIVDQYLNPLGYTKWKQIRLNPKKLKKIRNGQAYKLLLKRNYVTGATMAFRTRFIDIVLPIPLNWVHDGWITFFYSLFYQIDYINKPLIKYRQHTNNQLGGIKATYIEKIKQTVKSGKGHFQQIIDLYTVLLDQLIILNENNLITTPDLIFLLERKLIHENLRMKYHSNLLIRLFQILAELLNGNYFKFGHGFRTAIRDMFS